MHQTSSPIEVPRFNPELQGALDQYAIERAGASVPGLVAKLGLAEIDLNKRELGHPTLLSTHQVPASSIEIADNAIETFSRRILNFNECVRQADKYCADHGLDQPGQTLIVMTPHMVMPDTTAMSMIMRAGINGEIRNIQDMYMFVSRMIAYINFINPLFGVPGVKNLVKPEPKSALEKIVLTSGNGVQIFQDTTTTQILWSRHEQEMDKSNRTTLLQTSRHMKLRRQEEPSAQQILFIAPTATRTKKIDGKYKLGYISDKTIAMLKRYSDGGAIIIPAGLSYFVPVAYVASPFKTRIKMHLEDPICAGQDLNNEDFEHLIKSALENTVKAIIDSRSPIYWEEKPKRTKKTS